MLYWAAESELKDEIDEEFAFEIEDEVGAGNKNGRPKNQEVTVIQSNPGCTKLPEQINDWKTRNFLLKNDHEQKSFEFLRLGIWLFSYHK